VSEYKQSLSFLTFAINYILIHFRAPEQSNEYESPVRHSGRFSGDSHGKDLKLNGSLPDEYEVDMLDSDVKSELFEFGLVGGPQSYQGGALCKVPCW
jgi:hypothetical protein